MPAPPDGEIAQGHVVAPFEGNGLVRPAVHPVALVWIALKEGIGDLDAVGSEAQGHVARA